MQIGDRCTPGFATKKAAPGDSLFNHVDQVLQPGLRPCSLLSVIGEVCR